MATSTLDPSSRLVSNLPALQNQMKRDPLSYCEELSKQLRFFDANLQLLELSPGEEHKALLEVAMFLAQVSKCYPAELSTLPERLVSCLRRHGPALDPDLRMGFCRALILLRHRDLLGLEELFDLFFDLLKCQDKSLRKFLRDYVVSDVKASNAKRKDGPMNTRLQNRLYRFVGDAGNANTAKTALDVLIELYRKNVWHDAKTVNVIATACFSDVTKLMVTSLNFFLGHDEDEDGKKEDSSDDEDQLPTVKSQAMANAFNRNSRKRARLLTNLKKAHKKKSRKDKVEQFNFSALHLVHDPQGLAEKLFKKLDSLRERFEVKLLFLDLISRLIGTHELFLLSYYSYLARFLTPHQREVVQMLQFAAQSAHELVPPDAVEPIIRSIVNNFVTERNTAEVMAVGLNAIRELCRRCPLAMDATLLRDLAEYKTYKDKGVMMASRSLIQLFRTTHPELLHKKDRGRPTEAVAELAASNRQYGEVDAPDYVPGAEALGDAPSQVDSEEPSSRGKKRKHDSEDEDLDEDEPMPMAKSKSKRSKRDESMDDDGWEDVVHTSDEEDDEEDEPEDESKFLSVEERKKKAAEVTVGRILTDADFKKIDSAQLRKTVQAFRKGSAKTRAKRQARVDEEEEAARATKAGAKIRSELVNLSDIEMVHKKRRHDKQARLETVMAGREDREKFGSRKSKMNENASTTNKVKSKNKNFMMVKHKIKRKAKRGFVDKQKDLKRSLMRSKKFK